MLGRIKQALIREDLLRRLEKVRGEWTVNCLLTTFEVSQVMSLIMRGKKVKIFLEASKGCSEVSRS
jgi:hypothetical protein